MTSDARHRDMVGALWALLGAVAADDRQQVSQRAVTALAAIAAARGADSFVLLHEQDGALHVNGRQLRLAMGVYPAAKGLTQALRCAGLRELLLDQVLDEAGLLDLVRPLLGIGSAVAAAPALPVMAVDVEAAGHGMPLGPRKRHAAVATGLPLLLLQHQLMAAIPRDWVLPPPACKAVLQAIVERLLQAEHGLQALERLQCDPEGLAVRLRAALLCVAFLRVAGWPAESLAEHGVAALLADLPVPSQGPAAEYSAFLWLLDRGEEDLWLRSALVAQSWRGVEAGTLHELGLGCDGIAAFLQFATAVDAALVQLADPAAAVAAALRQCRLPPEFGEVALAALGASTSAG